MKLQETFVHTEPVFVCVCVWRCMHMCMYVCMYVCVCVEMHAHTLRGKTSARELAGKFGESVLCCVRVRVDMHAYTLHT